MVTIDYNIVFDQALIHFALIGDEQPKGAFEGVIPTSSKFCQNIGFRENNIGSTHTFCTHNIKSP